jgi:hypothetical protein
MPPGGGSVANRDVDVEMDVFMTDLLGNEGLAALGRLGREQEGDERPQLVANKRFSHAQRLPCPHPVLKGALSLTD